MPGSRFSFCPKKSFFVMGFCALGFIAGLGGDLDIDGEVGGEGDSDLDVDTTDLGFLNFFLSLLLCLL